MNGRADSAGADVGGVRWGPCSRALFLVTVLTQPSLQVDGEEDIGKGLSLYEMAELLLQLGCWQAVVGDLPSRSYDQ